jgi:hypothetical protein
VLGIEPGSGGTPPPEEVVASAFKKLAIRWHPDRNPDKVEEATQRFAEISAARDLLLDPPVSALHDDHSAGPGSAGGDPYPKSAHSQNLRAFENDVTDAIVSGELAGPKVDALFDGFELWAVWHCTACDAVCCRIRKNKYTCMCSHRLRDHRAGAGFRCASGCGCKQFSFQVQFDHEPVKCRCKHPAKDHAPAAPWPCKRGDCACDGFDATWICNCGHGCSAHRTAFVRKRYAERAREWVAGGLRGECVALAKKFRARSAAERAAFVARANAAKAAGLPSWKALQREQRLHAKHGTEPLERPEAHGVSRDPQVAAEAARDAANSLGGVCGECDDDIGAASSGSSAAAAAASAAAGVRVAVGSQGPVGGSAGFEFDRQAARQAGFHPSNETTHGMSTEELRAKLAEAGVGIRPAAAADLTRGAPGLW